MTTTVTTPRRLANVSWITRSHSTSSELVGSSSTSSEGSPASATGDHDPLALPARERPVTRPHEPLVPFGERGEVTVEAGQARRPLDLVVGDAVAQEADVVGDRPLDELRLLRHQAHLPRPVAGVVRRRGAAVHEVAALARRPEAEQELHERRLPGTRGPPPRRGPRRGSSRRSMPARGLLPEG
jgi:hypothetical protein